MCACLHPSAVVHASASLAEGVVVGPLVVIERDVQVGAGTVLLPGTVLMSGSRVGEGCRLGPYASVGGEPMDTGFKGETSYAVLEDKVTLRDFASVHRASGEGAETRVGEGSYIMSYAHVSHNVRLGKGCTITTSVQLGGHVLVGDYANLGAGALVHQYCRIGAHAMYGAGSATNQDVLPYSMARGNPAKHYRLNKVGLARRGITGESYSWLEQAIRAFRRRDWARVRELAETSKEVAVMLAFKESTKRGLCSFV